MYKLKSNTHKSRERICNLHFITLKTRGMIVSVNFHMQYLDTIGFRKYQIMQSKLKNQFYVFFIGGRL